MKSMWWLVSSSFSNSTGHILRPMEAGAGSRFIISSEFFEVSSTGCKEGGVAAETDA